MKALFETSRLEALLTKAFEAPVEISRAERLVPWFVARCQVTSPAPEVPPSVIVKTLRDGPSRSHPHLMCTERAALEFVTELEPGLVPRVLASDVEAGLLVLEDLAPRVPLASILEADHASLAAEGLLAFARTLGTLSTISVGHQADYYARRRALGPVDPMVDRQWGWNEDRWNAKRAYLQSLGVEPPPRADADLARALAELTEPGPFLAFSNGDAGENNYLVGPRDDRLIDFEAAGYRHAVINAVCLYVPWTMWITASDPIAGGLETAYRTALSAGVPEASDDGRFGLAVAAACLVFAIHRMRWAKLDPRPSGDHSRLQMVSTLEAAAWAADYHRSLPHLSEWVRQVASKLRHRWPDTDVDLSEYPSHTPRVRETEP